MREGGFTLIELMVTLAVAAVALTIAVPSFTTLILNNRMAAQSNQLITALHITRSEAIRGGHRATLCVSSDQSSCSGGNWAQGWIVWVDLDDDATLDNGEIVQIGAALEGSRLAARSGSVAIDRIGYLPTGFADLGNGGSATFALRPSKCRVDGRDIILSGSGSTQSRRVECSV